MRERGRKREEDDGDGGDAPPTRRPASERISSAAPITATANAIANATAINTNTDTNIYSKKEENEVNKEPGVHAARKRGAKYFDEDEERYNAKIGKEAERDKLKLAPGTIGAGHVDDDKEDRKVNKYWAKIDSNNKGKLRLAPGSHDVGSTRTENPTREDANTDDDSFCLTGDKDDERKKYDDVEKEGGRGKKWHVDLGLSVQTDESTMDVAPASVNQDESNLESTMQQQGQRQGRIANRNHRQLLADNALTAIDADDDSECQSDMPGAHAVAGPGRNQNEVSDDLHHDECTVSGTRPEQGPSPDSNLAQAVPVDGNDEDDIDEEEDVIGIAEPIEDTEESKGLNSISWISEHGAPALILTFLLLVAVTTAIVFVIHSPDGDGGGNTNVGGNGNSSNSNNNNTDTTSDPTEPPEEMILFAEESDRFRAAYQIFQNYSRSETFLDSSSAQYQALSWLADVDEAMIEFETYEEQPSRIVQRYSMAVFYFSSGGEGWTENFNFLSSSEICEWKGVHPENGNQMGITSCNTDGLVTRLRFGTNGLNGTIPDELSNIISLNILSITDNVDMTGPFFEAISGLVNLADIRVFGCSFSGTIPTDFGRFTNLVHIAAQHNEFVGTIPSTIGDLSPLENMYLSFNQLEGSIPTDMGRLTNLRIVQLDNNLLTGSIPSEMSALTALRQMDISFNSITEGGNNLCTISTLVRYVADCLSQTMPAITQEIDCTCCSVCCSELFGGCISNVGG